MKCVAALAIAGTITAVSLATAAQADDHGMVVLPSDQDVKWQSDPAQLPKGTKLSVIFGDPSKPGPFVLRVSLPANTVIAPHTHATAESLTILTGSIQHDMGEKLDKSRGKEVRAGGFVFLPADMPHSLWTGNEATTLQVNGTGPFGLTYVNPADDPSNAPK